MKLFKKLKNKKPKTFTKSNVMTQTATLPDQYSLDTSDNPLAVSAKTMPENQPATDPTSTIDEPLFQQENNAISAPSETEKTNVTAELIVEPIIETMAETSKAEETVNTTPASNTALNDTITETLTKPAKIKLTGRMLNFSRLHISGNDFEQIQDQLNKKFANQPNSKMLVVLSCDEKLDLAKLLAVLWELGLQPIGIVTGQMDEQASEQKLAIFPADGKRIDVLADDKKANKTATLSAENTNPNVRLDESVDKKPKIESTENTLSSNLMTPPQTSEMAETYTSSLPQTSHLEGDLIYTTMLRSGQSINHVGGDLILTQGINAGAEAITDYSLHVYGKAEGRLVAGATGDENARIFCLRFNPSLVSVAGTFCLRENIPSEYLDKAVQVHFERDKGLVFTLING